MIKRLALTRFALSFVRLRSSAGISSQSSLPCVVQHMAVKSTCYLLATGRHLFDKLTVFVPVDVVGALEMLEKPREEHGIVFLISGCACCA